MCRRVKEAISPTTFGAGPLSRTNTHEGSASTQVALSLGVPGKQFNIRIAGIVAITCNTGSLNCRRNLLAKLL